MIFFVCVRCCCVQFVCLVLVTNVTSIDQYINWSRFDGQSGAIMHVNDCAND